MPAPAFSVYSDANGKVPTKWTNAKDSKDVRAAGDSVAAVSGVTYIDYQATVDNSVVPVKFVDKNGKELLKTSVTLDKKDTSDNTSLYGFFDAAKVPAAPTVDGYTFLGWKSSVDGKYVSSAVNVTFRDTNDYAGSHADVKTTVNAGGFINTADVPDWTRDGYTLSWHLKADGSDAAINFNTYLVNESAKDFVIYAKWTKATVDNAVKALNYVKVKDYNDKFVNTANSDDSAFFTDASWTTFKTEYKKAYQTYRTYVYGAANNSVTASKSAEVISTLNDAWKGLRFTAEDASTVITNEEKVYTHAKVIYRLADPASKHLYSSNGKEIKYLTNQFTGQGGWRLDNTNFLTVNNDATVDGKAGSTAAFNSDWVDGKVSDATFLALVNKVVRLYNGREHLYTSDKDEIAFLKNNGWSQDGDESAFYVPALYTTSEKVVRLYNPGLRQHLYTSDVNEANKLVASYGWQRDSDKSNFYAL